jgi:hypothetical protein
VNKPVVLSHITYSNRDGEMIVREEFGLTFGSHETAEVFIQSRHKYWQELLNHDLFMAPQQNETLEDLEIIKLFKLTAKYYGVQQKYIFKRTRIPKVIEARRIASAICTDLALSPAVIGHAIGFDRTNVIHHLNKFDGYYETEPGYKEKYHEIKEAVLNDMNGKYAEDGSGKKIDDEKS